MAKKKKPQITSSQIAINKKARQNYFLHQEYIAGLSLEGWEVKSLRAGKVQLTDTYVLLKNGEAWLMGCHITPINTICTHTTADPQRKRKLLLHKKELHHLTVSTETKGNTCVPVKLFWKQQKVKCAIALASGKKDYDKRHDLKEKDWKMQQSRLLKYKHT